MVLRNSDRRFAVLAVVCSMTASLAGLAEPAGAQTGTVGQPPSSSAPMIWGGRLPEPGEAYRPSVGRREAIGSVSPEPQPAQPDPQPSYPVGAATAPASIDEQRLFDDLVGRPAARSEGAAPTAPSAAVPPPPSGPISAPISVERTPAARAAVGAGAPPSGSDPWARLKASAPSSSAPAAPAPRGQVATLGAPTIEPVQPGMPHRGALQPETPEGYILLPKREALCRVALKKIGVRYTDISAIGSAGSCGIPHPVKITQIAEGVAMKPAATLNCDAAFRISQWVENEVKPAARWRLWTSPTAVLNASSYRCSKIAGSRTISEHASGNALDVRGFEFSNGDVFDVEKKGFFSFRQKGFQKSVRHSACEHFGTVLGPGYNYDHRDHLHLDAKNRRRVVCK